MRMFCWVMAKQGIEILAIRRAQARVVILLNGETPCLKRCRRRITSRLQNGMFPWHDSLARHVAHFRETSSGSRRRFQSVLCHLGRIYWSCGQIKNLKMRRMNLFVRRIKLYSDACPYHLAVKHRHPARLDHSAAFLVLVSISQLPVHSDSCPVLPALHNAP